jgi:hypothetical protein
MFSSLAFGQQKKVNVFSIPGSTNIVKRFFSWADGQSDDRFIWLAIALLSHASVFTPITAMIVMTTSNNFSLVMISLAAMGLALVTNLAALPTRITIPAFFLSILVDVAVVITTFAIA